jgi:hypothetical protein
MPKKGKKEGGLPSDFYLKLQRPKVFDRELKARDHLVPTSLCNQKCDQQKGAVG